MNFLQQKTANHCQSFLVSLCLIGMSVGQMPATLAEETSSDTISAINRAVNNSAEVNGAAVNLSQATGSTYPWTPEDLAQAAYEGHLEDEGIPGYETLATECLSELTMARDVLRAAVKAGMMPSRVMDDASYLEELRVSLSEATDVNCS
jgi:hypothetical protein